MTNLLLTKELPPHSEVSALSFYEAVAQRRTVREIAATPLSPAQLSSLLWVACGVNRTSGPDGLPGRTAASASNSQEIDLYVALEDGAFLYNAAAHRLDPVAAGDLRTAAINPHQKVDCKAPVQLIYVADLHRLTHTKGFAEPGLHDPEIQKSYYFVDTGIIAGNVYLFAAAHGLACWFHNCDKSMLTKALALRPDQKVLFAQSVGFAL
ncbi:nitroreductase family protein [Bradyrhizobium canariense]|uniref:nitroreductase family protein n=1 Tax=Bradyrhizobium canariense TaxID=255045 RepID=UPI001B8A2330|nr:nitroreductase family protein [Bradyrhizobium canariense]MBR0955014.1 nitroreductase family protein [Bradyrhizobium canariense]